MKPRSTQTDQLVAPAAPVVAWPSDEARHTVVHANQGAWQRHTDAARGHRESADRLDEQIAKAIGEKQRQDHYATQEQWAADAFAVALTAMGEQVPPPPVDRPVTAGMSQLEAQAHAAAWNGMDPNPTGVQPDPLDRFNAAHNEYAAENPEVER